MRIAASKCSYRSVRDREKRAEILLLHKKGANLLGNCTWSSDDLKGVVTHTTVNGIYRIGSSFGVSHVRLHETCH